MFVSSNPFSFIFNLSPNFGVKAFLVLFLIFYNMFALILFRQTQVMSKTLPTELAPTLKFIAIIHVGLALAVLILTVGNF